jgi:L-rhamnose-H+ transport protein
MRYLGMSLGMAVALGYCAAFGTLVPPIVKGEFADKLLNHSGTSAGGPIVLVGVVVCLIGIALGGIAGVRKERDMGNDGKSSAISEFSLWKGLAIATFSGVMSSCFSYGFQFGDPITKISASHGTGPFWVGLPVIVVILLGGLTTNFIWCVMLNIKNRTGYQYLASHVRAEHAHHGGTGSGEHGPATTAAGASADLKIPVLGNWFFCALAGTFWYFQFFFYQMGESQMGNYKFSSWTLHMASIIIFSTLWGIFFKEWRGAKSLTKSLVVIMLLFLVGSTCIIGWGNKISEDAANAAAAQAAQAGQK